MNQAILVNKVRASSTQATGSDCRACPTMGLPILPVRYAVVPKSLTGFELPSTCANPLVSPEDKGKVTIESSKYALRTLRPGFLYITYEHPSSGARIWQCFMISPSGSLREIPLASKGVILPEDPKPICERVGHNINSSFIALKNPEKIHKAYIGYSEHFWSRKAFEKYKNSFRNRLIEFSPSSWISRLVQDNAIPISQLEKNVVEYSPKNIEKFLKTGAFDHHSRSGQATALQARMEKINPGKGMVLAIPDPIGCICDLNSYRMHMVDARQKYIAREDVSWKLSCAIQIEGLRSGAAAQVKESLKNAKPKYVGNALIGGRVRTITKEDQIKNLTEEAWKKLAEHYDEEARVNFIEKFKNDCAKFDDDIFKLDTDYVNWKKSRSLALVIQDFDRTPGSSCIEASKTLCRVLEGGPVSAVSTNSWKEMLMLEASNLENYAISAIMLNQEEWLKKFENTDAKNLVSNIWGDNSGKIYDFSKNFVEAKEFENPNKRVNDEISNLSGLLAKGIANVIGAIASVISSTTKKTGRAVDAGALKTISALESLQIKLGAAYSYLYSGSNFVVFSVELTVNEWHRIMSESLRKSMEMISRQATKGFAAMAVAARVSLPADSVVASKLISFTFWMSGSVDQITKTLNFVGNAASGGVAATTKAAAKGAVVIAGGTAKASVSSAGSVAGSAAGGVRKLRILAHALPAEIAARLPTNISATTAGQLAAKVSRNSLTILGAADAKLAAPALGFQIWALWKASNDINGAVGYKYDDAQWTVASSILGFAGASFDLFGKSWKALSYSATGAVSVRVERLIRHAGFVSAGASVVDCFQAIMRMNVMMKRGDNDAAAYQSLLAVTAVAAGGASLAMAFGYTALLGPVGILLACIVAGIALTILAANAQDLAIEIWLDRCKFGYARRIEGKFATKRHEADSLELVYRNINIELEWLDKPFTSLRTNEISVCIKRSKQASDGLIIGLVIEGRAGRRKVIYLHNGLGKIEDHCKVGWPVTFSKMEVARQLEGGEFEARIKNGERKIKDMNEGEQITISWEEKVELNPEKFDRAKLMVRYFPDKNDGTHFFDEELLVADDSSSIKRINSGK